MNDTAKRFSVVSNEIPDPPYPPDMRAKGMMFDIDVERLYQSKTWLIASADLRPWLLRLWVESWRSIPVGSFEDDDELVAARIQMPEALFQAHRKTLMRGWVRHSDGNLYHPVITEMVLKITTWRENERERKRLWREKMSRGTDAGQTRDTTGKTAVDDTTSTSTSTSVEVGTNVPMSESPSGDSDRRVVGGNPPCPHSEIIALYHETLPELSAIAVSRWPESKDAKALQARWREDGRHQSLDFWGRFFATVRTNPHWMGQGPSGWSANLRWLVKRDNFAKVIDRMVDNARREGVRRG